MNKIIYKDIPLIMGIVNVTPDSFFDGNRYNNIDTSLFHIEKLIKDGADIIDIGGESTKPYSESVSLDEELRRVIPILTRVRKEFPEIIISVDTNKSKLMEEVISIGADMINDVSGLMWDKNSINIIKKSNIPIVVMHSPWKPKEMQDSFSYKNGVLEDIYNFFLERVDTLTKAGIKKDNIILDPGIGFGKSVEDNFLIISKLSKFNDINQPILLGASNKSYIGKTLNSSLENRKEGNSITEYLAYKNGVSILRVHNVASTRRTLKLAKMFENI